MKSSALQNHRVQESAKHSAIQHRYAKIVLFCCRGVLREGKSSDGGWTIQAGKKNHIKNGGKECYDNVMELKDKEDGTTDLQALMDNGNHLLNEHGLKITKIQTFLEWHMKFDIKEADHH